MKKKMEILMAVLLLAAAAAFAVKGEMLVGSKNVQEKKTCIVLDPGHGGFDPGKVGVGGVKEKDVNLQITEKLKALLEEKGILVVMTRSEDTGLYQESSKNKKAEDMRGRCELIAKTKPDFTVSIHQNSFPDPGVKGAQVFYYGNSKDSEELAKILQDSLKENIDPENKRAAAANTNYYLLKKTPTPTVIVECGFLSNPEEEKLLTNSEYQDKMAAAICKGILAYLGK